MAKKTTKKPRGATAAKPSESPPPEPAAPASPAGSTPAPPEAETQPDGATGFGDWSDRLELEVRLVGPDEYELAVRIPPSAEFVEPVRLAGRLSEEQAVVMFGRALAETGKSLQGWGLRAHGEREARQIREREEARWGTR